MGEAGSYRKPGDSPQGAGVVLSPAAWVEDGVFGRRKRREDEDEVWAGDASMA